MHKLNLFLRIVLLAFWTTHFPLSFSQSPEDGKEKIAEMKRNFQQLLEARRKIPNIFEESTIYGTNLYNVLSKQKRLQQELDGTQEYEELKKERKELANFKFESVQIENVNKKVIDPERIREWKEQIKQTLTKTEYRERPLSTSLVQNAGQLVSVTPWLIGASSSLSWDKAKKGAFFQMPVNHQIEFLQKELAEREQELLSTVLPKFDRKKAKVDDMPLKDFLALLKDKHGKEEDFKNLIAAFVLVHNRQEKEGSSSKDLIQLIEEMDEEDFRIFETKALIQERLSDIQKEVGKAQDLSRWDFSEMKKVVSEEKTRVKGALFLEEVPPSISIFRGTAGSDCATEYSFGYPNCPVEKVFFLYNSPPEDRNEEKQKTPKGYVSGTIVNVNGQKTFYLHTIAGKRISGEDARIILNGFYDQRKQLGVEEVMLPNSAKVKAIINYEPIKDEILKLTQGRGLRPIKYLDTKVRSIINGYSGKDYDMAETNTEGHIIVPIASDIKEIRSSMYSLPGSEEGEKTEEVPAEELIPFALDLDYMEEQEGLNLFIEAYKVDQKKVQDLKVLLANKEKSPTADFVKRVSMGLEKEGIAPEPFIRKKTYLMRDGLLEAPDAGSEKNWENNVKNVVTFLENDDIEVDIPVGRFIGKYHQQLRSHKGFMNHLKKLSEHTDLNDEDDREYLIDYMILMELGFLTPDHRPLLEKVVEADLDNQREYLLSLLRTASMKNPIWEDLYQKALHNKADKTRRDIVKFMNLDSALESSKSSKSSETGNEWRETIRNILNQNIFDQKVLLMEEICSRGHGQDQFQ